VKQSKKATPNPAVAPVVARIGIGASGSKGVADAKKATAPVQTHRVPTSCMLAGASSHESLVLSPHDPTPRNSLPEAVSRLEPKAVPRSELEASL
jgi:hypothetical protein